MEAVRQVYHEAVASIEQLWAQALAEGTVDPGAARIMDEAAA